MSTHMTFPTVRTVRKKAARRLARRAKKAANKSGKGPKLGVYSTQGVSCPPWLRRQLRGE